MTTPRWTPSVRVWERSVRLCTAMRTPFVQRWGRYWKKTSLLMGTVALIVIVYQGTYAVTAFSQRWSCEMSWLMIWKIFRRKRKHDGWVDVARRSMIHWFPGERNSDGDQWRDGQDREEDNASTGAESKFTSFSLGRWCGLRRTTDNNKWIASLIGARFPSCYNLDLMILSVRPFHLILCQTLTSRCFSASVSIFGRLFDDLLV